MKQNGFVPIIIIIAVGLAGVIGYGIFRTMRSSLPQQNQTERIIKEDQTEDSDFSSENTSITPKPSWIEDDMTQTEEEMFGVNYTKQGNLTRQSGTELDGWILLYDAPGNPAVTSMLKFTNSSMCDMGNGVGACDASTFTLGDRVEVSGNIKENMVTVSVMKKL